MSQFYTYSVPAANGEECGFTPQYKDLESIYETYHDQGLEILDIPCNQFAGQTPGTDEEIHEFCTLKYNTQFPQMKKSDVNGENELSLYTYLKSQQAFQGFGKGPKALAMSVMLKKLDKDYKNNPNMMVKLLVVLNQRLT